MVRHVIVTVVTLAFHAGVEHPGGRTGETVIAVGAGRTLVAARQARGSPSVIQPPVAGTGRRDVVEGARGGASCAEEGATNAGEAGVRAAGTELGIGDIEVA